MSRSSGDYLTKGCILCRNYAGGCENNKLISSLAVCPIIRLGRVLICLNLT